MLKILFPIQIIIILITYLIKINYINDDYYEKWLFHIWIIDNMFIMLMTFLVIRFIIFAYSISKFEGLIMGILFQILLTIFITIGSIRYESYYYFPIKLDYINKQVIELNTNKKLKPIIFKSTNSSSSEELDKLKDYFYDMWYKYKLLIDNDKNYYIFGIDNFKKEFYLKSVYFNKKTYSLKYTYSNKENKELYDIKENISAGGFYKEYEKYNSKFKKIKINEDEGLFENN